MVKLNKKNSAHHLPETSLNENTEIHFEETPLNKDKSKDVKYKSRLFY